ncbi:MAG: LD-carboxypeptidase [Candidatus Doudnabacteria bacterium]|nr:LD-carboxypeptidase [Candidatus Doudnabacteria bacterium]
MYPKKLLPGDEVRVIAPAKSFKSFFPEEKRTHAIQKLEALDLKVSFGKYVNEVDEFESTTVEHRLEDLHDAFSNKNVKAILTVLGGSTSNQLLKFIDYKLIRSNPKILCGLSDITALANAIYCKTGLVTYSGPHFTLFGADKAVEYTINYFKKCLFSEDAFEVMPSETFCDKRWDAEEIKNEGYWTVNQGEVQGTILGGNLLTFKYLQGTDFAPDLTDSILFLEDNDKENFRAFENQLQSLINQPDFIKIRGIIIGRFQKGSGMTKDLLTKIVRTKRELDNIPVAANIDFGHTTPTITFPIGGEVELVVTEISQRINIAKH